MNMLKSSAENANETRFAYPAKELPIYWIFRFFFLDLESGAAELRIYHRIHIVSYEISNRLVLFLFSI